MAPSRAELKNKEDFDRVRMRIQETVDLFEILEGKRKVCFILPISVQDQMHLFDTLIVLSF